MATSAKSTPAEFPVEIGIDGLPYHRAIDFRLAPEHKFPYYDEIIKRAKDAWAIPKSIEHLVLVGMRPREEGQYECLISNQEEWITYCHSLGRYVCTLLVIPSPLLPTKYLVVQDKSSEGETSEIAVGPGTATSEHLVQDASIAATSRGAAKGVTSKVPNNAPDELACHSTNSSTECHPGPKDLGALGSRAINEALLIGLAFGQRLAQADIPQQNQAPNKVGELIRIGGEVARALRSALAAFGRDTVISSSGPAVPPAKGVDAPLQSQQSVTETYTPGKLRANSADNTTVCTQSTDAEYRKGGNSGQTGSESNVMPEATHQLGKEGDPVHHDALARAQELLASQAVIALERSDKSMDQAPKRQLSQDDVYTLVARHSDNSNAFGTPTSDGRVTNSVANGDFSELHYEG